MKLRNGYVSNSSSSSFVLNSSDDLDLAAEIFLDSFPALVNNKEWTKYYHIDIDGLKQALQKSIKNSGNADTLRVYVFNLFWYVIMHYEFYYNKYLALKENDACVGCPLLHHHKCYFRSRKKEKETCYWKRDFVNFSDERKSVLSYLSAFPFHFPVCLLKECRKQMNDHLDVTSFPDGSKFVNSHLDFNSISPLIYKEVDKWLAEHPKACLLEFASDESNECQAVLRYNLGNYVRQAREKGIEGFYSDNS